MIFKAGNKPAEKGNFDLDQIGIRSELIKIKTQTQEIGIDDFGPKRNTNAGAWSDRGIEHGHRAQ
jgi:hypothetical protein